MNTDIIRLIKKELMVCLLFPFRLLPIKSNRIMLVNNLGNKYACNPKYVGEYLNIHYKKKFEIYFAVNKPDKYINVIPDGIKPVRVNSLRYYYLALTSRVFLTNSGMYSYLPIRKSQYVINTWHGGGAYKNIGLDVYPKTKAFIKDTKMKAKKTSVVLSTCKEFSAFYSRAFLLPRNRMWEIGMPRNDLLIHGDEKRKSMVRKRLGLKSGEKLVLYAPTYRKKDGDMFGESVSAEYGIDFQKVVQSLNEKFGGEWVFGFRYHPCIKYKEKNEVGVLDLSNYEDMQELLLVSDVLINDYSSSMWDFALSKKPCFIFAEDIEEYSKTAKLYTPISKWPFPIARNNDEMCENIRNFDNEQYQKKVKKHLKELGCCETGNATKLTAERIFMVCQKGKKDNGGY